MNVLEREIKKCTRRIKKIEQHPDPTKLKSNRLFYEAELKVRQKQLQAWKDGKPFVYVDGYPYEIFEAMGFEVLDVVNLADRSVADSERYFNIVREAGLPIDSCDRVIISAALALSGDMPPPSFIGTANLTCFPHVYCNMALEHHFDVPSYNVDVWAGNHSYESIQYITDQLREMIDMLERSMPGIKFDEDRLAELQAPAKISTDLLHDIYGFKKAVPCPITGQDALRMPPFFCVGPYLEWTQAMHDEIAERVAKGQGVLEGGERMRMMWLVAAPLYVNVFDFLEKRGVSVPIYLYDIAPRLFGITPGYGDETEYGRKLTPLEEAARIMNRVSWGQPGPEWYNDVVQESKHFKVDGVVHFMQSGCATTIPSAKIVADRLEKEVGIPTLMIDGRSLDSSSYDQTEFQRKLEDFINLCALKKGT
ncbi:MAG: 2-hydroxyacyl-CoA dehydratase family protein [Thermodesulfobacteriota bacterium]|nr:2-hydroxyacyl-CoA dehydratase family protein [Thermodesulfobacteriota bacterium]